MPKKAKVKKNFDYLRYLRYALLGGIAVAMTLLAAYLFMRPAQADEPTKREAYWTEWEDTTQCIATQCGVEVGVKGQERQYVTEVCEYSCPVVHWEYDFGRIHRSFDVEYLKSKDPNKCHRPSKSQLEDLGMWRTEAIYFTQHNPEWKVAEVGECKLEVLDTEARRTECRLEEVEACGTIRWCFACEVEGHDYCAEAVPNNKQPDEGFPWKTGMDKYCEVPEEEPEPKPEPKKEEKKNTFTEDRRCHDSTPPAITWINVEDGSANNDWLPRATWSAEGGEKIEVCFSETLGDPRWCFTMENDGHETLGLMENTGLLGMVQYYANWRTVNGCKDGPWTAVDWFN